MRFTVVLLRLNKLRGYHVGIGKYFATYARKPDIDISPIYEQWKEKYAPILNQSNTISPKLWDDMRKYVIESNNNSAAVDVLILRLLGCENCSDAGYAFYNFLKSNNHDLPVSTVCKYMELYINKEGPLSTTERDHVYNISNDIINMYTTYDYYTAWTLIQILCKIDKWKEAIKVLEKYEAYNKDKLSIPYMFITAYFFTNGHEEFAHKYLSYMLSKGIVLQDMFYDPYFKYCLKEKHRFNEKIEKLFALWCKYGVKPCKISVLALMEACNQAGWSAEFSSLKNGRCEICSQKLVNEDISDEAFAKLHKVIKKRLISGQMYEVTNPDEVERFIKFIDERKPYDIVIDALNVLHKCSNFHLIRKLLKRFQEQGKKVLLIGRHHVLRILQTQQLVQLADYFLVEDVSHDDIFLLYAAFSSKKDTYIISNDLMRNHEYCIASYELKSDFKKWQISHQYSTLNKYAAVESVNEKHVVDAVVQKNGDYWHVPYVNQVGLFARRHRSHEHWVCLNICP